MSNTDTDKPAGSTDELLKENRILKRRLMLAEQNLARAQHVSDAKGRVEATLNESFRKEQRFFQLVLENTNNILLLLDFDGRFAYASNTFLEATDIANFGLINGTYYSDILKSHLSAYNLSVFTEAVDRAVANRNDVYFEQEIDFASKGMPKTFSVSIIPMYGEDGKSMGILLMLNDITEIRHQSNLLATALMQANAASKAKGDFLSNMSHEMRTPLNAIIGMTAIGKKTDIKEEKDYALRKISDASAHLLGVINDILDMSKIEADKLEFSTEEFDFECMLQNVITVVNFRIEEKKQHFTVDIDESIPPFIIGDDQRLAQVIANLLSNAVKFTPEGGNIHLEASLAEENDGDCELRIIVTDNGIGISKEQQEHLFQAFMQAQSGTSREFGGTGLGLAISKRIVENMGGRIWVESELGKGARFCFTVKVQRGIKTVRLTHDECISDCLTPEERDFCHTADVRKFEGKKLLIAEDIEINREIIVTLLQDSGLIIDCAENGIEALEMIQSAPGKYDIVFMDVQMPKMDGLEATRRIRRLPASEYSTLPIVAMTAHIFKSDIEACLAAGMNDHLGKPLDIEQVFSKLRKYLL